MDNRKLKILTAVVDEYIHTGEPVGSKAVMNQVKASSATIRNDMAELEKQGLLYQPHTSAGRLPTYQGLRLYVDSLMEKNPLTNEERQYFDSVFESGTSEEEVIKTAQLALSQLTSCATVVANSTPKFSIISKVEVIPTGKRLYVILMITSNGSIKNKTCRLQFDLTDEQLEFFGKYMQENLEGMSIDNISDEVFEKMKTAMGAYMMTLSPLVSELIELSKELTQSEISITGQKNLLTCKDFNQNEIISFLDNQRELANFIDQSFSGLHVMFSSESDSFVLSNSSLITSSFKKNGKTIGTLGLVGPVRLDYAKFIPYLEYFTQKITDVISAIEEKDEENDDNNGNNNQ